MRSRCAAWRMPRRPTTPINVTGPETIEVRWLAEEFGKLLGKTPTLTGKRGADRLAQQCRAHGRGVRRRPACRSPTMIDWTADWLRARHGRRSTSRRTTRCAMASTERPAIRPIDAADEREAVWPLSIEAGWNQIVADWRFMLGAGPRLRRAIGADGRLAGQLARAAARPDARLDQHGAGDQGPPARRARHAAC